MREGGEEVGCVREGGEEVGCVREVGMCEGGG